MYNQKKLITFLLSVCFIFYIPVKTCLHIVLCLLAKLKRLYSTILGYVKYEKEYKKLPKYILLIDRFNTTSKKCIEELKNENTAFLTIKMKRDKISTNTTKIILYDDNTTLKEGYPDLIILIDYVQRFYLEEPLLLYKAEIYHSRHKFSKKTYKNALKHYSECEIRNGK